MPGITENSRLAKRLAQLLRTLMAPATGTRAAGWCRVSTAGSDARGATVILAVMMLLMLSLIGILLLSLVATDLDIAAAHLNSVQALFVAEAGRQFAVKKLSLDSGWIGLPSPGKAVGVGSFVVDVGDSLEDGTPLSSGQKYVAVTATVNSAERKLRIVVSTGGSSSFTTWAVSEGDAKNIPSNKKYNSISNIRDSSSGPNGTYGDGGWASNGPHSGLFTGFSGSGNVGTVTQVEAIISFYISSALSNDKLTLDVYLDNSRQGSTYEISTATLNSHVGISNKGEEYIDVTDARSWSMTDFDGDLELFVQDAKQAQADNSTIYIDAIGYRVTFSSSTQEVAGTWKELIS